MSGSQLHWLLSRWLSGVIPPHLHNQPSRAGTEWAGGQPYALGGVSRGDGLVRFEVRLLIDALVEPWLDGVKTETTGTFGRGAVEQRFVFVQDPGGEIATCTAAAAFSDLLTSPRTAWVVELISPTTWKRGGRYVPDPSPTRVLSSLQRRWRSYAPAGLSDLGRVPVEDLGVIELGRRLSARTQRLNNTTVDGVTGHVAQMTQRRDPATAEMIGALLGLARFCGLGYHTTHGLGDVVVH